jgi:hypothetical protein
MTRDKVVIPMVKKKLGTISERTKGKPLAEIEVTQYALEQLQKRLRNLEDSHNSNDHEMRELHIKFNLQAITIKRLQDRLQRSDAE